MNKIKGLFQLFRIELPLAAGLCTLIGVFISADGIFPLKAALLGFLSVVSISSSAMVLNDYFDLETDRVNAPHRPLPSGLVSARDVILLAALTAVIGLLAAVWISLTAMSVAALMWMIGFLYNWKLKSSGLVGNLMVSSCVASMFIFGGVVVGDPLNPVIWTLGILAFCFDLGEEIAADAMDVEGDRLRGSRSLAILKGRDTALSVSGVLFGLCILISLLPVIFGWFGLAYWLILPVMDGYILFCTVKLLRSKTIPDGRKWVRRNYLGVVGCLLAFLLGSLLG